MVLADFLNETRRRWLQAFKMFKSKKSRKSGRNRVSPVDQPYSGTVDARQEIDVLCPCRTHEDASSVSTHSHSLSSSRCSRDSAYESDRGSPARVYTVTYFNVNDAEDTSSIHTEYTLLDCDPDAEETQNFINESLELVSSL